MAHHEPPHLDLGCLQIQLFSFFGTLSINKCDTVLVFMFLRTKVRVFAISDIFTGTKASGFVLFFYYFFIKI